MIRSYEECSDIDSPYADVIFIFSRGSTEALNFEMYKESIRYLIENLSISNTGIKVGLVAVGSSVVNYTIAMYNNRSSLDEAFEENFGSIVVDPSSRSAISSALNTAFTLLTNLSSNG